MITEAEQGDPLNVGRKSRAVPSAMFRALQSRDQGCRFPGCTHRHYGHAHHSEHRADGSETKLSNLVLLCAKHHRLVHEGGFDVTRRGKELVFTRPDRRPLEPITVSPILGDVSAETLERLNHRLGLDIDERTGVTQWDGYDMDYAIAMDCLWQAEGRL